MVGAVLLADVEGERQMNERTSRQKLIGALQSLSYVDDCDYGELLGEFERETMELAAQIAEDNGRWRIPRQDIAEAIRQAKANLVGPEQAEKGSPK